MIPSDSPQSLDPNPQTLVPVPRAPFWDYSDFFLFTGLLVASLTVTLFLAAILLKVSSLGLGWKLILPQLILYALVLSTLAAILRVRYDQPLWRSLGWRPISLAIALAALLAGPFLAIGLGLLGTALHTPEIDLPFQQTLGSPSTTVMLGVVVVILGPVCEELVFRGFLMPLLVRSLGVVTGVVATGVLFGAMHGYEYEWSWRHMLLISMAGCIFGWASYKTRSTTVSVFMHSTFNLTQFAALLWQSRTL
jgi:membrane protease YdiL (CAAX protease family)